MEKWDFGRNDIQAEWTWDALICTKITRNISIMNSKKNNFHVTNIKKYFQIYLNFAWIENRLVAWLLRMQKLRHIWETEKKRLLYLYNILKVVSLNKLLYREIQISAGFSAYYHIFGNCNDLSSIRHKRYNIIQMSCFPSKKRPENDDVNSDSNWISCSFQTLYGLSLEVVRLCTNL